MRQQFDAIVIGAGQAGPFLAARLVAAGQQVALIERKHLGGTCVNEGCTPTKTLVASARVAHLARRAADFGVSTGPVAIDMLAVKARMDEVVAGSRRSLADWLGGMDGLRLVDGTARFVAPDAVEVDGERLSAPRIFLNTGCRAVVPEFAAGLPYLTNSSILQLEAVPRHLVIIGGSYIGLEFAQIYRRLGAEVTVLEQGPRIASREDEEFSSAIADFLGNEGIRIVTGASGLAGRASGEGASGISLTFSVGGESEEIAASHLLLATGRQPNTDDLGLDAAGVATDKHGYIPVDDRLCTNVPHIFALGDVNRRGAFTHTSYNDFEIVAANLLDGGDRKLSDRVPVYALYTDPPLGRAGMTEAEAKRQGHRIRTATRPMSAVGRARERGETAGMMKVVVEAETDRILGAALLGIEGDEAIHVLVDAIATGTTASAITRIMHIHPTVSELIPTLLGSLGDAES